MKTIFDRTSNLVIDLGMNNGDDTDYYLRKGYRVVAVEANSTLCSRAKVRFQSALAAGKLEILNVAIWSGYEKKSFFVNLDNDHWSSLDKGWAERESSTCTEVLVDCIPLGHLFSKFGVPHYLKIDIEGADELAIAQLKNHDHLPFYLSLEDCRFGYQYMAALAELGYEGFKLLDQSQVEKIYDATADHRFMKGSSGPFGEELPGEWLTHHAIEEKYSREVRDRQHNRLAPRTHWWDIHCRGPAVGSAVSSFDLHHRMAD